MIDFPFIRRNDSQSLFKKAELIFQLNQIMASNLELGSEQDSYNKDSIKKNSSNKLYVKIT